MRVRFLKGHGTENDFVLLPDLPESDLDAQLVRALCDRHAGIGADGVLRVGRDGSYWFMDYRNADGSLAEMCGNGARVFGRYLVDAGLAGAGEFTVSTRGGKRRLRVPPAGDVTVDMGAPRPIAASPMVDGVAGVAVSMGNPHVVVPVATAAALAELELTRPPRVTPPLPEGQNVEFVHRLAERHLRLRVHERGVGETRSCGTGVCAAVVATAGAHGAGAADRAGAADGSGEADGAGGGDAAPWIVDVPGGRLRVRVGATVELTGPAVLVAEGQWLPR